jgi:hypothetical protein
MKVNKYIYPLIGVAIAGGILMLSIKSKKGDDNNPVEPTPEPEDGSGVSPEQKKPDPTLSAILANANATTMLKGKKIYSKIANIKARTEARVNDGLVNNLYGDISNAGTYLGTAMSVLNDGNGAQNTSAKRVYKWVKVQLSKEGYDAVQANRSFLTRDLFTPSAFPIVYFREDVIKL